jgi:hypothetical protein
MKPNTIASEGMGELQNDDAATGHDDKDAINIGRLGVQQELKACSRSQAIITMNHH